jgi:site-specific recombinase XerD
MTTLISVNDSITRWIENFLTDRRAQGMSNNTLLYYSHKLNQFNQYAITQSATNISDIDANLLRRFLLWLESTNHNPGGRLTAFRAVHSFLYWVEEESGIPTDIRKVKPPKVAMDPLEGVPLDMVMQMAKVCERGTFTGDRDYAILLGLLDCGCRAREFLGIQLTDLQENGGALIRFSKSHKPRTVYFGKVTYEALLRYLLHRVDDSPYLWVTVDGGKLSYTGLREIVGRRAKLAGLDKQPALHSFRRAFTLSMLRSGTDIYTLAKMLGHSGIDTLKHYLKLTSTDTFTAHQKNSPVNTMYE